MVSAWLVLTRDYSIMDAIRVSTFNIVSVVTTTGFGLDDFTAWGHSLRSFLPSC